MVIPTQYMNRRLSIGGLAAALILCATLSRGAAFADGFSLESAGVRGGLSANSGRDEFHEAEGFLNVNLPWHWSLGRRWNLKSRLDFSAGWLGDSTYNAALGSLGPTLVLRREGLPLSFEGGSSPTGLSRYQFENKDLGTQFQFTSHVGLNFDVTKRIQITYRFHHISNAGLSSSNPGLNMHLFGISFLF
jgi:lipid A 3-O-deacylase